MHQNRFDLLLTDMIMPGLSGMELIDRLRQINCTLPVLVMTAYGCKDMVVELMRKECADFLEKPINPQSLLDSIAKIFEKSEAAKAEFDYKIESYENHFTELNQQIDAVVDAYQSFVKIREHGYKVITACFNQPLSTLGGDFTNIINTPDGCDVFIADVSGHDMGAAFHAVLLETYFKENSQTGPDFFRLLNRKLREHCGERMVTGLFLCLNLTTMIGKAVSAGHPPLIMHSKTTNSVSSPPDLKGDVLGIFEKVTFQQHKFCLTPGDRLLLFTDGLIDAYRVNQKTGKKEIFGQERLKQCIEKHAQLSIKALVRQIGYEVNTFSGFTFKDDILLLGLQIPCLL